jgi:hypothetical protein
MTQKYILGGGPAGLIAAFYNPDHIIVDKNPMGQLNLPFVPGPRILKVDDDTKAFLIKNDIKYNYKYIYVGYADDGYTVYPEATQEFKEKYSLITRGTTKIESSFLSSGENEIQIFTDENGQDLYYRLFQTLTTKFKNRTLSGNVLNINTKNKTLTLQCCDPENRVPDFTTESKYEDLISTLNVNIMFKLLGLEPLNLVALKKHFVQCEYNNNRDIEDKRKYHYVYSTDGMYTRKTYFKDYIVYEMCEPVIADAQGNMWGDIQGNKILKVLNNIPIQINNSIDFRNIQGIDLVGRFAQWNHSIKANEVIQKYEQRISRNL